MSDAVKVIVGESESVEINVVGEGESAEVNIPGYGIIKGDKGDKGDKGEKGDPFISGQVVRTASTPDAQLPDAADHAEEYWLLVTELGAIPWSPDYQNIELFLSNGLFGWQYLGSLRGDRGSPGLIGEKGEKGDKGDKGDPGDENVFMARFGVTTEEDLTAALNAKKYIYAVNNGIPSQLYALSDVKFGSEPMVGDGYVFTFSRFDGTVLKRIVCRYGTWLTLEDIDLAETGGQTFWFGTRVEYNALSEIDPETVYCIEEGT